MLAPVKVRVPVPILVRMPPRPSLPPVMVPDNVVLRLLLPIERLFRPIEIGPSPSIDPTLRLAMLRASEDIKYTGRGRNIFQAQIDIPKVVASPVKQPQVQLPPPGPPPPPPIPLQFFGFANKPGETKRIFLSQGEDVFIAGEGDIVNRRYKVVRIGPSSVEIEDVLNNNRQSIPLTQG